MWKSKKTQVTPDVADWLSMYRGLFMPHDFRPKTVITVNETAVELLGPLLTAIRRKGIKLFASLGELPTVYSGSPANRTDKRIPMDWFSVDTRTDPAHQRHLYDELFSSSLSMAKRFGLSGFHVDDETTSCPRLSAGDADVWFDFMDSWGRFLHSHGLELSAAVQDMWRMKVTGMPIRQRMLHSEIDVFATMDTYWGDFEHFNSTVDFYCRGVPGLASKIHVGFFPEFRSGEILQKFDLLIDLEDKHKPRAVSLFSLPDAVFLDGFDFEWRSPIGRWQGI
mmetsp:Transcript_39636/g.61855  ORF Transcript_39636/g.61855 Transcript_39636/m.61855 type:complete len:280 (+) Transcript_39636:230-1069(+)